LLGLSFNPENGGNIFLQVCPLPCTKATKHWKHIKLKQQQQQQQQLQQQQQQINKNK
jgi:hypothetical protein